MHHTGGSGRRMQAGPIKDDDMAPSPSNFMGKARVVDGGASLTGKR